MAVGLAWTTLGFDAHAIIYKLIQTPKHLRVLAVQQELEVARKAAQKLLIIHHPDKGGDMETFKRVNEAIQALELHTSEFARKMKVSQKEAEERLAKRPFIKVDPK